jgi:hypothetical protein
MTSRSERCPTCKRRLKRSSEANRRYWLLLHTISDKLKPQNVQHSPEVWHHWAKMRFLGAEEIKLPNGKTLIMPHSSAELDKAEFQDYMEQLEAWAAEHDVYLDELETIR